MFPTKRNIFQPRGLLAEGATQPPPLAPATTRDTAAPSSVAVSQPPDVARPVLLDTTPPAGVSSSVKKKRVDHQHELNALLSPRKIQFESTATPTTTAEQSRGPHNAMQTAVPPMAPQIVATAKPPAPPSTVDQQVYQTLVQVFARQIRSQLDNILVWVVVGSDEPHESPVAKVRADRPSSTSSPSGPSHNDGIAQRRAALISQLLADVNEALDRGSECLDGTDLDGLRRRASLVHCDVPPADARARVAFLEAAVLRSCPAHPVQRVGDSEATVDATSKGTHRLLLTGINTEPQLCQLRDVLRVYSQRSQRLGCVVVAPALPTRDEGLPRDGRKRERADLAARPTSSGQRGAHHRDAILLCPHNARLLSTAWFDVVLRIFLPT